MKMRSRLQSLRSASFAYKEGYVDVSVTSPPLEFGSTSDHVRILRKVIDGSNLPSRAEQFFAIVGCPAAH
jgi:hypothetical protein